jgi:hypothetical protein
VLFNRYGHALTLLEARNRIKRFGFPSLARELKTTDFANLRFTNLATPSGCSYKPVGLTPGEGSWLSASMIDAPHGQSGPSS